MVFNAVLYSFGKILEKAFQLYWHIVWVEATFMGIADDGRLTVVGSHDDEAIGGVEDIKGGDAIVHPIGGCKLQIVGVHIAGSYGCGGFRVDGKCQGAHRQPENGKAE